MLAAAFCLMVLALMLGSILCLLALASPGWGSDTSIPEIILKEVLQGKEYSLSQFRGKVVVINFFTFYCEPCREGMPDLNQINEEFKGKGLQTLGIALSSDPTQIRFLVKQLGLEYPVLIGNNQVSDAYGGITVVPTTLIIDKQSNVVQRIEGLRKKGTFKKLIAPLL